MVLAQQSWSQSYQFGLQGGIGSWSMSGLKTINELAFQGIPFNTRLVADFPPYIYYKPSLLRVFDGYSIGLVHTFQSTGSRISGRDYSGEYRFDMKVKSYSPGVYYERELSAVHQLKISFYATLGCSFSRLKITEYLRVLDTLAIHDNVKFKSLNFYGEPGINLRYPLKPFSIGLNGGYFIPFGNQAFYTNNNKNNILYDTNKRMPITPGWKGFRIGIGLYYLLDKQD